MLRETPRSARKQARSCGNPTRNRHTKVAHFRFSRTVELCLINGSLDSLVYCGTAALITLPNADSKSNTPPARGL